MSKILPVSFLSVCSDYRCRWWHSSEQGEHPTAFSVPTRWQEEVRTLFSPCQSLRREFCPTVVLILMWFICESAIPGVDKMFNTSIKTYVVISLCTQAFPLRCILCTDWVVKEWNHNPPNLPLSLFTLEPVSYLKAQGPLNNLCFCFFLSLIWGHGTFSFLTYLTTTTVDLLWNNRFQ